MHFLIDLALYCILFIRASRIKKMENILQNHRRLVESMSFAWSDRLYASLEH